MALDQTANFVRGAVGASIASGDTTVSVVDASLFPDPANGNYNLVLWDAGSYPRPDQDPDVEVVRVTGRDTTNDDLAVTRAQEATSDVAHPATSQLALTPTAKMFADIDSQKLGDGEDFDGQGSSTFSNVKSVATNGAQIGRNGEYIFASKFSGSDADARLDNAISASADNQVIYLEGTTYIADRSISNNFTFIYPGSIAGAEIDGTWTLNGIITVDGVRISDNGVIEANSPMCAIYNANNAGGSTININGDYGRVIGCDNTSVTFGSGTSRGIVDASTRVSVTDNGSNTVGDIA